MSPPFDRVLLKQVLLRLCLSLCAGLAGELVHAARLPNIVIIYIDDMGFADIGPFGAKNYETPHLNRMAMEGRCFTDFHTSAPVCSASRAALLTGCYHERVGIRGALFPGAKQGLNLDEITLAELCRSRGYATGAFGKWHLGDEQPYLPLQHGFDEYFGLPYSNDMWPQADVAGDPISEHHQKLPKLPLLQGNKVFDDEVSWDDQNMLTTWYTERAVDFIDRHHDEPFFLYVPHSMVHVPLGVSEKFRGKSGAGMFGDVVMEIDWSVGQILETLERHRLTENTLVVFTSDNGPWLVYGEHAGSAKPFREGKQTVFEGGHRVPCVMRWPGKIPQGTICNELAATIDLLPTVAKLIGAELPQHTIDGKDIWPLVSGERGATTPHEVFYCYFVGELRAIRTPRWKLILPHKSVMLENRRGGKGGRRVPNRVAQLELALYDLETDPSETTDVSGQYPEVVTELQAFAEDARAKFGDKLTGQTGTEVRPAGKL